MANEIATTPQAQPKAAPSSGMSFTTSGTLLDDVTYRMLMRRQRLEQARRERDRPRDPQQREAVYTERALQFWRRWWPAFLTKTTIHEKLWLAYQEHGSHALDPEDIRVVGVFGKNEKIKIHGRYGIESDIEHYRASTRKADRVRGDWIAREYTKAKRRMRRLREKYDIDGLMPAFAEAKVALTLVEDDLWDLPRCKTTAAIKAFVGLAGHLDVPPNWFAQRTTEHMVYWTLQFLVDIKGDLPVEIANPITTGVGFQDGWSNVSVCEMLHHIAAHERNKLPDRGARLIASIQCQPPNSDSERFPPQESNETTAGAA